MRHRSMGSRLTAALPALLVLLGVALVGTVAHAQGPVISYPQEGEAVRGTINVLIEGIPEGGYAMVYVDGRGLQNLRTATTERSYSLNTFTLAEGPHTLTIVAFGAGGRRVGETTVNFQVANARVEETAEGVRLINWTTQQRMDNQVQRYRVYAVSNATISTTVGPKAPWLPEWQVGPDQGKVVVEMIMPNGEEFNATRKKSTLGLGDLSPRFPPDLVRPGNTWRTEMTITAELVKREPINVLAPMTFTSFENVTTPAGVERRAARLESRFPLPEEVARTIAKIMQPFAGAQGGASGGGAPAGGPPGAGGAAEEVEDPGPLDFQVTLLIRRLVRDVSMVQGAANLQSSVAEMYQLQRGSTEGGAGPAGGAGVPGAAAPGGAAAGGPMGADGAAEIPPLKSARGDVVRVMWFDVAANRVLRAEDVVNIRYEEEPAAAGGAPGAPPGGPPGMMGGGDAGAAAAVEPVIVTHNLRVVKWLDDLVPPPTESFTAGRGTAHAFDSVEDPSVSRVLPSR